MKLTIRKGDKYILVKDFIYFIDGDFRLGERPFKIFTPILIQIDSIQYYSESHIKILFHTVIDNSLDKYSKDTDIPIKDDPHRRTIFCAVIYNDKKVRPANINFCIPESIIGQLIIPQNEELIKLDQEHNYYYEKIFSTEFNHLMFLREKIDNEIRLLQNVFEQKKCEFSKNVFKAVEDAALNFEENIAYRKNLIDYLNKD